MWEASPGKQGERIVIDPTGDSAAEPRTRREDALRFQVEDWGWDDPSATQSHTVGLSATGAPATTAEPVKPSVQPTPTSKPVPPKRRLSRPLRLLRGGLLLLAAALISIALWSYVGALTAPGSASVGTRTVEWISNSVPGGRPVVLLVERLYYKWTAPPAGGTPAGGLPRVATPGGNTVLAAVAARPNGSGPPSQSTQVSQAAQPSRPFQASQSSDSIQAPAHLAAPARIQPIAANPLPDEGQWQVAGRLVEGLPALRVTYLRPDVVHTSLVAGVMWLDTRLLRAELVPGTQLPSAATPWTGLHFSIPAGARANLVATFNSGFLLRDSGGGWYGQGRVAVPLADGVASLVIYKDGTGTVAKWGRDVTMDSNVAAVRQNLQLIVDDGQINPDVATDNIKLWGRTLGNTTLVWRSGVGVTGDGALVYAAGNKLSVHSLAEVLQRAGCVRAMELDINSKWTSANYYQLAAGDPQVVSPIKLLPDMTRPAGRYLVPDERDFIAIFARG
jgi:hypothetical protein